MSETKERRWYSTTCGKHGRRVGGEWDVELDQGGKHSHSLCCKLVSVKCPPGELVLVLLEGVSQRQKLARNFAAPPFRWKSESEPQENCTEKEQLVLQEENTGEGLIQRRKVCPESNAKKKASKTKNWILATWCLSIIWLPNVTHNNLHYAMKSSTVKPFSSLLLFLILLLHFLLILPVFPFFILPALLPPPSC